MNHLGASLCLLLPPCLLAAGTLAADPPAEPTKLTACAYVTVRRTDLVSKAGLVRVEKAAREGIPEQRFGKLTVIAEGTLLEAKRKAADEEANVFLHVTVGEPARIRRRQTRTFRWGRHSRRMGFDSPMSTLRCPMTVELSTPEGKAWRQAATVKLTSADVAGAEEDVPGDRTDIAEPWAKSVRRLARAGCEKALASHFLRNVTLKAVECEPSDVKDAADKDALKSFVKVELLNRSRCRIADATVTTERYNARMKRWEAIDAPRGLTSWLERRFGRREDARKEDAGQGAETIRWPIPGHVDPGGKGFSEPRPVGEKTFMTMRKDKCRLVLHATPLIWRPGPPKGPPALKPTPDPAS